MWVRRGLLGTLLSAFLAVAVALKAGQGGTASVAIACGAFLTSVPTFSCVGCLPWSQPATVAGAVGSGFFVPLAVVNVFPVWRDVTNAGIASIPFLKSSPTANTILFGAPSLATSTGLAGD
ncbi:conserved hypothetical protein [Neospora caninum Liverpool]|uniref:Transmembrane protein n=1 Tax=Neospora caninum (strain Liverpool) TaxID=572307 RepID=F0VJT1_NEOCL|nr:conserved hypothetical protein [Neospora caninum Liverpool]CBZ53992.1 conserved hypothetical protein [Neospora caninum Liverpool]|eukprot:XP_003884024.1 conserved hypothetical protein [Neospora caninum Liverpool]